MSDDIYNVLLEKVNQIAIDVAIIKTKSEATGELKHEERIKNLETFREQWTTIKLLIIALIPITISLASYFRK